MRTMDVTPESTSKEVTVPFMVDLEPSVIPTRSSPSNSDHESTEPIVKLLILLLQAIMQLRLVHSC